MNTDHSDLLALPAAEQLRIVEMLWDNLGQSSSPIPWPDWIAREGARRRDEMLADPTFGSSHEEIWDKIERRIG
jgi:putative addiction module component (TIGR02574 family)